MDKKSLICIEFLIKKSKKITLHKLRVSNKKFLNIFDRLINRVKYEKVCLQRQEFKTQTGRDYQAGRIGIGN